MQMFSICIHFFYSAFSNTNKIPETNLEHESKLKHLKNSQSVLAFLNRLLIVLAFLNRPQSTILNFRVPLPSQSSSFVPRERWSTPTLRPSRRRSMALSAQGLSRRNGRSQRSSQRRVPWIAPRCPSCTPCRRWPNSTSLPSAGSTRALNSPCESRTHGTAPILGSRGPWWRLRRGGSGALVDSVELNLRSWGWEKIQNKSGLRRLPGRLSMAWADC